jgi:hypothetical protein
MIQQKYLVLLEQKAILDSSLNVVSFHHLNTNADNKHLRGIYTNVYYTQ